MRVTARPGRCDATRVHSSLTCVESGSLASRCRRNRRSPVVRVKLRLVVGISCAD